MRRWNILKTFRGFFPFENSLNLPPFFRSKNTIRQG